MILLCPLGMLLAACCRTARSGPTPLSRASGSRAFINHAEGLSFPVIGAFLLPTLPDSLIDPPFFSQDAIGISGTFEDGAFAIRAPSAPEPATWSMMLLGLAALGFSSWRAKRKSFPVAQRKKRAAEALSRTADERGAQALGRYHLRLQKRAAR